MMLVDLRDLGFDRGGQILVKRALARVPVGSTIQVTGSDPHLALHLLPWCRLQGHAVERIDDGATVTRGAAAGGRWKGAVVAGRSDPLDPDAVVAHPDPAWGFAPRGALVEAGGPSFEYAIASRAEVWNDGAQRLYRQAAAAQWDPATAIDWKAPIEHDEEIEDSIVQIMTYLIENEMAALQIPSSFVARIHPHFQEVVQVLAIQAADEARHVEVFTRRATLRRTSLGLSTVGGRQSLKTLLDEPDFALASFLLSVLGEGSFLSLLRFLSDNAPDAVTAQVARLAGQDEARHVAFGVEHLRRHVQEDRSLLARLARAVEARHRALRDTSGLNEEVFDALVILAAGDFDTASIERGHRLVEALQQDMDRGRKARLCSLGFDEAEATRLSALHTRNFM
jgi:hypothetical protein